jgi:hypothetical protein
MVGSFELLLWLEWVVRRAHRLRGTRGAGSATEMPDVLRLTYALHEEGFMQEAAAKFDAERAAEYERQSRIALAGYEACHALAACLLAAALDPEQVRPTPCHVLVVGAGGTAQEVQSIAALQPAWRFTAVDPSPQMLDQAMARLRGLGLDGQTEAVLGTVQDLSAAQTFDAATVVGVLHHLPGDAAKRDILQAIAQRLAPVRRSSWRAIRTATPAAPCCSRPGRSAGAWPARGRPRCRPSSQRSCRGLTRRWMSRPRWRCCTRRGSGGKSGSSPACSGRGGLRFAGEGGAVECARLASPIRSRPVPRFQCGALHCFHTQ